MQKIMESHRIERVFIISIRKDIDKGYEFPEPFSLQLRLKDMLDDEVDEKFYLSLEQMGKIVNWKAHQKPFEHVNGDNSIVQTLTARGAGEYHSGMITYSPECTETTNLQLQVKEATKNKAYDAESFVEGTVIDDTQGFDGTRYYNNVSPSLRASRSGLKVVTDTVTNSGCDDEVVVDE